MRVVVTFVGTVDIRSAVRCFLIVYTLSSYSDSFQQVREVRVYTKNFLLAILITVRAFFELSASRSTKNSSEFLLGNV